MWVGMEFGAFPTFVPALQIRRRRPTPASLVLSSDQSSPEIDEDRLPNALLKSGLAMSPRQRKKVYCTTPTVKELQMMVEHHLCKQARGEEDEEVAAGAQEHSPGCCHHGDAEHSHSPGGSCPLAQAQPTQQGGPASSSLELKGVGFGSALTHPNLRRRDPRG
uniref:Protein phosphatase 1 regulatory subunit 1A n=1 Tax=Meleagris gallopavo TaxID=9103 RepID=A0A803XNE2_MELGA